ncbi:pyridoxamine 5'-phosphate oxidase family protein [Williamsia sterculiae]|uniref:Pyridoxamine 5'-phosphate oxidase n=1 Tax=Williamsia sterculiae TaxID=1344003 RepID=A0A1N7ENC4_9NOCA|nr:pyridoxamine 5'-phosphate oxidase family protein [Williamsia sterculiae]SIR89559.1 Pyridoxamine 5'-phosphate oxidase [Williamsia sterculiae]
MNETTDELEALQELLDRSAGGRTRHLTDIVSTERRLSAERICTDLDDVVVLDVATVSRAGVPRLSAVDGHFLHATWYFSTASSAVKARDLLARPAVSVAYTPRDGYGIWTHGDAVAVHGQEFTRIDAYLSEVYGMPLSDMADGIAIFRVEPRWMVGFAMTPEEQAEFEATLPARAERRITALRRLG